MEQTEETWLPSKQKYDTEITKEKWIELLHDENIFNFNSMCMMRQMLDIGGQATNTELSKKYGTKNGYNGIVKALAKRMIEETNCKLPPQEENAKRWPVLFIGKKVQKDDEHDGTYIWKLRPELEDALKQMDANGELEKYPLYEKNHDSAWLLTWNEKNWNWEKYDNWCAGTKNGETYTESWTCKSKQPKIGDHVFLIKLGDEPRGIIAHGFVSKESYDAPVFDSKKAEQVETCPHIDVEFDAIRNYKNEDILKIETLQSELPSQTWCPQFSGSQIKEENVSKLLELWNELNGEKTMSTKNSLVENLANLLKNTHNLILHGAPGTGKTHLAHEIAKAMNAETSFVQFHPSYDYTDFVEGLRPVKSSDGTSSIGFERKDGVFKEFCKRALKNLSVINFLKKLEKEKRHFYTIDYGLYSYYDFFVENFNQQNDEIAICSNGKKDGKEFKNELTFSQLDKIIQCKENINSFEDMKNIFSDIVDDNEHHEIYYYCLYKEFKKIESTLFLFIIDEINRGELSKIFGELFYAIEPGYRVKYEDLQKNLSGEKLLNTIRTQYANLETDGNEFDRALDIKDAENFGHFFIPENVYIIGTMNDIDRSVDTMDFAFRRRFTFYEIKAEENLSMLGEIKDESLRETAINKIKNLNNAISAIEGLNSSYHIGGAYFLKLNELDGDFEKLWNYHLEGLLREYLRGRDDAETKLAELKKAYDNTVVELVETTSQSDEVSHSEQSEES